MPAPARDRAHGWRLQRGGRGPDGRIYTSNNGGLRWIDDGQGLRTGLQASDYVSGSIDVVDPASGKIERLYDRCGAHNLRGPNDLVFDGDGGLWFTDLGKRRPRDLDMGFIYYAKADGSLIKEVIGGLLNPNGIGLSPDGKKLDVTETATGRLWAFEPKSLTQNTE
jgi:gluconolactonase